VPPIEQLYKFVVTSIVILLIPGPSVLFVISRGIILGRRAAIATVLGNSTGAFVQMALVALGLGAAVEKSVTVYNVIKFVGAAYLVYLGVQAFLHRADAALVINNDAPTKSLRRIVREGFVVGISNPKLLVFASAALPNFVDRKRGYVPIQMLTLAALFALLSLLTDGTYATIAGTARKWLSRKPQRLSTISGAGGIAIVGLGINLAVSRRHD
jgi:threonine/homoserine/homoserine lactone efflux protein